MNFRKLLDIKPHVAALVLFVAFIVGMGSTLLYREAVSRWERSREPRTFMAATEKMRAEANAEGEELMSLDAFIAHRKRVAAFAFVTSLYNTRRDANNARREGRLHLLRNAASPEMWNWLEAEIRDEEWKAQFWYGAERTINSWEVDPNDPNLVRLDFTDEKRLTDGAAERRGFVFTTASHFRRVAALVRLERCADAGEGKRALARFKLCMVIGYRVTAYSEGEVEEAVLDESGRVGAVQPPAPDILHFSERAKPNLPTPNASRRR